LSGFQ